MIIPASAVRLQWVRYIDINRNTTGIPNDELVVKAPASIPDPFWEAPSISIKADQAQPIWIEVHVPSNAEAGDYHGKLLVTTGDESFEMPVKLHVWDFEVPSQRHLSVINWWRFPGLGFGEIKPYSEEYWESSTTGRAGGMRKAPKRGRYVTLSSSCSWSFWCCS